MKVNVLLVLVIIFPSVLVTHDKEKWRQSKSKFSYSYDREGGDVIRIERKDGYSVIFRS